MRLFLWSLVEIGGETKCNHVQHAFEVVRWETWRWRTRFSHKIEIGYNPMYGLGIRFFWLCQQNAMSDACISYRQWVQEDAKPDVGPFTLVVLVRGTEMATASLNGFEDECSGGEILQYIDSRMVRERLWGSSDRGWNEWKQRVCVRM